MESYSVSLKNRNVASNEVLASKKGNVGGLSKTNVVKPHAEDAFDINSLQVKQVNNQYNKSSKAPFIVYIYDASPENNLGNAHPEFIGKRIFDANIQIIGISSVGTEKFSITFQTYQQANKLVKEDISNICSHLKAFIPDQALYKTGIMINIAPSLSNEEVLKGLDVESRQYIDKVERIMTWIHPQDGLSILHATEKVKLFARDKLPESCRLYGRHRSVQFFIPAVLRCYSCQRFGHGASACNGTHRCVSCGDSHEGACEAAIKFANCKLNHPASSKKCIFFEFNRIKLILSHHCLKLVELKQSTTPK